MIMAWWNWDIHTRALVFLCVFSAVPSIWGLTDPRDIYAINQMYAAFGLPPIAGWLPGGDPCGPPSWPGVECVNANITAITLSGLSLSGVLTEELGSFASIIRIDLSNNHIGGSIPSNLPITLRSFVLSDNQFTGPIPETLSSLGQLADLSLNNNQLTGPIPDVFQPFTGLINMDLSGNNLTSQLPPSMGNLSSLTTLHLQNNKLTGVLDVLQDLPLIDLNVENNLFSGPIPAKLLSIPNFRRDGNPFNTTVLPSPPTSPFPLPPSEAPSPQSAAGVHVHGPSALWIPESQNDGKRSTTNHIKWILVVGLLVVVMLALGLCLCISRCKKMRFGEDSANRHEMGMYGVLPETHKRDPSITQVEKAPKKVVLKPPVGGSQSKTGLLKHEKEHSIDMTRLDNSGARPSPLPFPLLPAERVVADPTFTPLTTSRENDPKSLESAKFFTIASLQQYTNSFAQENLIGRGTLGTVYRAQLPDGKVLAVKKLDRLASGHLSDREFLDLVSSISKIEHPHIVELMGCCCEHGQRLLVYSYCGNGTLDEALNLDDEMMNKKLSWNARMSLALQAAKALEYLHEVSKPPIVHRNLKSANVLLGDDLTVRVSDCGLAPLMSPSSMTQLQSSGYGAPELELGSYTYQSDVYSFGVVMLQLLTGRKAYDRSRPRGEQYLARWAFSKLYDIDALSRMVDPSLNGAYPSKSLSRVADIISLCIQLEPEFRPPMSEIVQKLLQMTQRDR